jgi:hypothetical protein
MGSKIVKNTEGVFFLELGLVGLEKDFLGFVCTP